MITSCETEPYLYKSNAVGRHGDVIAELIEEIGGDVERTAAKLELIMSARNAERETYRYDPS